MKKFIVQIISGMATGIFIAWLTTAMDQVRPCDVQVWEGHGHAQERFCSGTMEKIESKIWKWSHPEAEIATNVWTSNPLDLP